MIIHQLWKEQLPAYIWHSVGHQSTSHGFSQDRDPQYKSHMLYKLRHGQVDDNIKDGDSVHNKQLPASSKCLCLTGWLFVVFKEDMHKTQVFWDVMPHQVLTGYCHYKGASAFIFSVKQSTYSASCNGWLLQWRHALSKCWYLPTTLHC